MGASYRSHSTTTYANRTNTVLTEPAGIVNGDVLLLALLLAGTGTAPTPTLPAGFTVISGPTTISDGAGFGVVRRLAWKVAASESGSYTITHTAYTSQAFMICVQGADTAATPQVTSNQGTGSTTTALTLTTTTNDSWVGFWVHNWALYGLGQVPPTGTTPTFTERSDLSTSLMYLAEGVLATAGATGNKTHGNGNVSTDQWAAFLVAVAAPTPATHEQEGFRFRNDDGTEATATWQAAQDVQATGPLLTPVRLRFVVNATGDPAAGAYRLEYRKTGESVWLRVPPA
jgi:hypothetical protein